MSRVFACCVLSTESCALSILRCVLCVMCYVWCIVLCIVCCVLCVVFRVFVCLPTHFGERGRVPAPALAPAGLKNVCLCVFGAVGRPAEGNLVLFDPGPGAGLGQGLQ